jgi:hypothetical protein
LWIFWKIWNFGKTSCIKWCNWKYMVSEQFYMFAREWSLVVNSHMRVAVGNPFLAVGGLKEAQRVPVREHFTPINTSGHLPVARGRHSCSPPGALRAHTSNRSHVAEEKWKIAERCQLRCRKATVWLLCDAFFFFFLNGPPPTFRKF